MEARGIEPLSAEAPNRASTSVSRLLFSFGGLTPGGLVTVRAHGEGGTLVEFQAIARIDTPEELVAFRHGGILPYVLRQLVGKH